jgi:hypothetical protein
MRALPLFTLALSGCAASGGGARIERVDASQVPGLAERVQKMLGHHFHLDTLDGTQTIESAYEHLTVRGQSDLIIDEMKSWTTVFGTQVTADDPHVRKVTVLLWSNSRDFTGGLVYADSENGTYWHAYLAGRQPKK